MRTRTLKIVVFLLELILVIAYYSLFAVVITHTKLAALTNYEWVLMMNGILILGILYSAELLYPQQAANMDTLGDCIRALFLLVSVLIFYDLYGRINFIPGRYQELPTLMKCAFCYIPLGIYFLFKITKLNDLRQLRKSRM